jgi:hypothetical protein
MAVYPFQDRCLQPLGHPSALYFGNLTKGVYHRNRDLAPNGFARRNARIQAGQLVGATRRAQGVEMKRTVFVNSSVAETSLPVQFAVEVRSGKSVRLRRKGRRGGQWVGPETLVSVSSSCADPEESPIQSRSGHSCSRSLRRLASSQFLLAEAWNAPSVGELEVNVIPPLGHPSSLRTIYLILAPDWHRKISHSRAGYDKDPSRAPHLRDRFALVLFAEGLAG